MSEVKRLTDDGTPFYDGRASLKAFLPDPPAASTNDIPTIGWADRAIRLSEVGSFWDIEGVA